LRNWLSNALLATASLFLTYMAAEAAFSLAGLRYIPLRLHAELPEDIRVFAQSTKDGVLPHEPIVLLGDSYAQGYGDWLLQANPDRNGPFHSGHVIYDLTGRDVLTLGQSGAGSAEGIVALPAIAYARTASAWYLKLPQPSVAVIYFYEGNDLNTNLDFVRKRVAGDLDNDDIAHIDSAIAAYPAALADRVESASHFPLLRFLYRTAMRLYSELKTSSKPSQETGESAPVADPAPPNLVEVAGKTVPLPAELQSPALELTPLELKRAVLVFERSLAFFRSRFPHTPVLVIYVPSPLASYELRGTEVTVQPYMTGRRTRYPKEQVLRSSDTVCDLIRSASIGQGAGFLDLRPAVRAESSRELIHGPRDYKHFNREGMKVLGVTVSERINRPLAQAPCSQSRI
jgi:hypothetical protein